jgi:hypothetical protein
MIPRDLARILAKVAEGLGERADDFVFVGGAVTGLLVTDPLAPPPRPTGDVDVVVDITSYAELDDLRHYLRSRGFGEDPSGPICRWRLEGLRVDVMPARDPNPFGFSNRWYMSAIAAARSIEILPGRAIRVISAVHFLATKLDAFDDGRRGDVIASHDIEDVIAVIDGRPAIVDEIDQTDDDVATFTRERIGALLARADVADVVA